MDSIENYRQLRARMLSQLDPRLFERDPFIAAIAVCVYLLYWTVFYVGLENPWMLPIACVVLGLLGELLSMVNHEVLHGSVFKSKIGAVLFCIPISMINLISPSFWRFWHGFHHDSVDRWTPKHRPHEMGFESVGYPKLKKLLGPFELFVYKSLHLSATQIKFIFSRKYKSRRHIDLQRIVSFQILMIVIVKVVMFIYLPIQYWLFLELGPLLIQNYFSSVFLVTQHSVRLEEEGAIRTFSVSTPEWFSRIIFNNGYHIEHHLFPNAPGRSLPAIKRELENRYPNFKTSRYSLRQAVKKVYQN